MNGKDIFWELKNAVLIDSQEKFYEVLQKDDNIQDIIYQPDELSRENSNTTKIIRKVFTRVNFSRTTIRNLIFQDCDFHMCIFINSSIIDCEFHDCRFILTNTYKIHISKTYINPETFKNCLNRNKHQNIGTHLFQILLKNSRDEDQIEFERSAQFLFLKWKRYQDMYEIRRILKTPTRRKLPNWQKLISLCIGWLQRWLWEKVFGSGVRIRNFIRTTVVVIFVFSMANWVFRNEFGLSIENCIDSFYFTIISLTTLGYGDFVPATSCGRLFAAIQSVVGFCMFATLASVIYRRIAG